MDITLQIAKSAVMNAVAKQTSYIGLKQTMADGTNAYDKIFATNDDYEMLEEYWREAVNSTTGNLKRYIKTVSEVPPPHLVDKEEVFTIQLTMPARYDNTQTGTIQGSLFAYFTDILTSRWLAITHKEETEYYELKANASMQNILQKINYKKPPTRT